MRHHRTNIGDSGEITLHTFASFTRGKLKDSTNGKTLYSLTSYNSDLYLLEIAEELKTALDRVTEKNTIAF